MRWDQPWTPSADSAAVLTVTDEVVLVGHSLPAGSYGLWVIPRADPGPWTLIVSRAARVYHLPYPEGELPEGDPDDQSRRGSGA